MLQGKKCHDGLITLQLSDLYDFANWNSYCNVNLSSNEYKLLWESGRIFISVFLYGYIRIGTSVNTGYIIYLPNKRTEEKIHH